MAIEPRIPLHPSATDAGMPATRTDVAARSAMDAAAFERFYDDNVERVYAFVARRFADRPIAEELTAVAFERAISVARSGSVEPDALGVFTFRVAASAIVDRVRRARRHIPAGVRASDFGEAGDVAEAEALSDESATREFAKGIDGDRLRRAVLDLADEHRRAILVAYFDGLAPSEVAGALSCPIAEVPLRVHRALRALQAALPKESIDAA